DRRGADNRGYDYVWRGHLERVPRLHQVHAHRRAGAGRHGLAQDPERVLRGADVGRWNSVRLCGPDPGDACRCRWTRLALAQPSRLPDQGCRIRDWHRPRNALQPRLRPYAARAGDCLPRCRRPATWLPSLAKIPARCAVAGAYSDPPDRARDADPARGSCDAGGLCVAAAPRPDPTGHNDPGAFWHASPEVGFSPRNRILLFVPATGRAFAVAAQRTI